MQRRVHHLLRLPYFRRHELDLPLLIGRDKLLCIFETGLGDEEGSEAGELAQYSYS